MLLDNIKQYLANLSGALNVQVGSRIRVGNFGGTAGTVPANGTLTVSAPVPLVGLALPGQAAWFELIAGSVQVAAKGLTITDVNLLFATSAGAAGVITTYGQPTLTTLSPQFDTSVLFAPSPQLVQFEDIQQFAQKEGVTVALPFELLLQVTAANSTAGAIVMTLFLNAIWRLVNGLQEG